MHKLNIKHHTFSFVPTIENLFSVCDKYEGVTLFSSNDIEVVALNPYIRVTEEGVICDDVELNTLYKGGECLKYIDEFIIEHTEIDPRVSFIGSVSYDSKYLFETEGLYKNSFSGLDMPLVNFTLYKEYLFFDKSNHGFEVVSLFGDNVSGILSELQEELTLNLNKSSNYISTSIEREEYEDLVSDVIDHIRNGDIYQLNLSREIRVDTELSAIELAVNLYYSNNITYGVFQRIDSKYILSTSPELFFEIEDGLIKTAPIKGTIQRDEEDAVNELVSSKKEMSELAMIVDLLRNDISRVSRVGTVKVGEFPSILELKNVYHAYCNVYGELENSISLYDIMKALMPGGSISGCPKIKACQLIEKLENRDRSIYTGSFGYYNFSKKMVFNILIRTVLLSGNNASFSVGGGITVLSDPFLEFKETVHKADNIWKSFNLDTFEL